MAKKIKKFGATTLAAVLASSALVPAALAADPVQQQQVDEVVIVKDGKNITVTLDKYEAALRAEIFTGSEVKYVVSGEKIYKLTDYETALRSSDNNTPEEAIALLSKNDDKYAQKNLQTVEGEIKNGELVAKDETPSEEAVAVESVKAINDTTIEVTFGKDAATEEALVGKVLTLTDAEGNKLTATYSEKSLDKDGKAIFNLAKDQKLVDAAKYTVTGEGVTDAEFVAETAKAYVADFVKVTEAVPASAKGKDKDGNETIVDTNIAVAGVDQYGKEISIKNLKDVKVEGTVNGMPLAEKEITFANGTVTVSTVELKENDDLAFTLSYKVNDDVTTKSTIEYKVQKAEAAKVTTIELTTVDEKVSVPSGETIVFNAKALDQFKSPVTNAELRWVVNGKTVTAKNGSYTLDTKTPGEYKVQVFSVADSKIKAEKTVTIGAANLTKVTFADKVENVKDVTVTEQAKRFNNEEVVVGTVTPNEGAALTASNVNFHVEPGKDLTKEDIKVTAVDMKNDKGENVIVVKATTTKAGEYKVTPFVGEEFTGEKTLKASQFTVKTEVNTKIAKISNVTFDAKELKVGQDIYKEIVIENKHGEALTEAQATKDNQLSVKSNNTGVVEDKSVSIVQGSKNIEGQDVNKTYLKVTAKAAGTAVITLQAGDVVKTHTLKFVAPTLNKINVASSKITGVVAGDTDDKAKYNKLTFLDQDGKEMEAPTASDVKVTVKNAKGEELTGNDKSLVKLGEVEKDKDGKITGLKQDGTKAEYAQILPGKDVKQGTYTVTLSKEVTVDEKKQTVEATFQVVVDEARAAKTVELSTKSDKVVVNGTTEIMITPKDQYGEFIKVEPTTDIKVTSSSVAVVGAGEGNAFTVAEVKDPKDTTKVIGYKVTVKGAAKGSANIKVAVNKDGKELATATQAITVDNTAALVDKVEIKEVEGLQNAGTKEGVQLEAIVKDKNDNVVNVDKKELTWSIKGVKDAKGNALEGTWNAEQGTFTLTEDEEKGIPAAVITIKNGKITTTEESLKGLTVDVTVGVQTQNLKEAETTVTIGDAKEAYAEGFKVAKVDDKDDFEGDGTTAEITKVDSKNITFTFSGLNQYGEDFKIVEGIPATVATSDSSDLVATWAAGTEATADKGAIAGKLTVEAKSANGGEVYVQYKDENGKEAKLTLNITLSPEVAKTFTNAQDAADKAVDAAIVDLKTAMNAEAATSASVTQAIETFNGAINKVKGASTSKVDEANTVKAEAEALAKTLSEKPFLAELKPTVQELDDKVAIMFTKASLEGTGLENVEKLKLTGISTGVNLILNTDPEKLAYYAIVDKADYDKATEVRVEKQ